MNPPNAQFCENCGKSLGALARFCGHCGQAVQVIQQRQAPAPQPAPPTQPVERIVSALPMGSQRSGILGINAVGIVLVLTDQRILVARQTSQIMSANAAQAKEDAKQSGKGFFGQWGAVIGSYGSQRYLQMSPNQILAETAENYFIANQQVRSVKVKESYDDEDARGDTTLTIDAVNGKLELHYTQAIKKEITQAMRQTLGGLVR